MRSFVLFAAAASLLCPVFASPIPSEDSVVISVASEFVTSEVVELYVLTETVDCSCTESVTAAGAAAAAAAVTAASPTENSGKVAAAAITSTSTSSLTSPAAASGQASLTPCALTTAAIQGTSVNIVQTGTIMTTVASIRASTSISGLSPGAGDFKGAAVASAVQSSGNISPSTTASVFSSIAGEDAATGISTSTSGFFNTSTTASSVSSGTSSGTSSTPLTSISGSVSASSSSVSSSASPSSTPEFTLFWSDEFDGDSLDLDNWSYQNGNGCNINLCGWGNGEIETYTTDSVSVSDGLLHLTAKKMDGAWQSGKLISENKVFGTYGRIEARIQLPTGDGVFPAFWMLPNSDIAWPNGGEIDITEYESAWAPNVSPATLHYELDGSPASTSIGSNTVYTSSAFADGNFHIYGIVWTEEAITFTRDNIAFGSYENDGSNVYPFTDDFFLILNLAMQPSWGSTVPADLTEAEMLVDYVRWYTD